VKLVNLVDHEIRTWIGKVGWSNAVTSIQQ